MQENRRDVEPQLRGAMERQRANLYASGVAHPNEDGTHMFDLGHMNMLQLDTIRHMAETIDGLEQRIVELESRGSSRRSNVEN